MAVSKRLRFEILRRDNFACRYCGRAAPNVELTVDHVIPETLGGTDVPENLVAACGDCNGGKSSSFAGTLIAVDETTLRWAQAVKVEAARQVAAGLVPAPRRAADDEMAARRIRVALGTLPEVDQQALLDSSTLDPDEPQAPNEQLIDAACFAIYFLGSALDGLNEMVFELLDTLDTPRRALLDDAVAAYFHRHGIQAFLSVDRAGYLLREAMARGCTLTPTVSVGRS